MLTFWARRFSQVRERPIPPTICYVSPKCLPGGFGKRVRC